MSEATEPSGEEPIDSADIVAEAERLTAYAGFKTAIDNLFEQHPDKILTVAVTEWLRIASPDPRHIAIINVGRPLTHYNPPPNALIAGHLLKITYINEREIRWVYGHNGVVVKWTKKPSDAPAIIVGPSDFTQETEAEREFGANQSLQAAVEYFANLRAEQRLGLNGQPVSTQETRRAIALIEKGHVF